MRIEVLRSDCRSLSLAVVVVELWLVVVVIVVVGSFEVFWLRVEKVEVLVDRRRGRSSHHL
jgi:hypothetical protein